MRYGSITVIATLLLILLAFSGCTDTSARKTYVLDLIDQNGADANFADLYAVNAWIENLFTSTHISVSDINAVGDVNIGGDLNVAGTLYSDINGYIPYVGASQNIDVSPYNLITTGGFGVGKAADSQTGLDILNKIRGIKYTYSGDLDVRGLWTSQTLSGSGSTGYGRYSDGTTGAIGQSLWGAYNNLTVNSQVSTIYGTQNQLSISAADDKWAYGIYNYIIDYGGTQHRTYGSFNYLVSAVVNNPDAPTIAYFARMQTPGTDIHMKKWAFYNTSDYIDSGKMWMGKDNTKTYWGTGFDASIYYDSADFVINPKEIGAGGLRVEGDLNILGDTNLVNLEVSENLFSRGNTFIGSGTNLIDINSAGYLELKGSARVKRELIFPARNSAKGASAPTEALRDLGASGNLKFPVLEFSKTTQQDVYGEFHPPTDIDDSQDVAFHLMWVAGASWTAGDFNWCLEYLVKFEDISYGSDVNTTLGTPTIICEPITPVNPNTFIETEFLSTIDVNNEQTLTVHFYRDVATDNGDDHGDVRFFEAEYYVNKLGEAT